MPSKLEGLHPNLVLSAQKVLEKMALIGHPMVVTAGIRSAKEQSDLFAQGRTKPGKVVTNADGVRFKSNHQVKDDGFGHAVDCAFVDAQGRPSWDLAHPWAVYGALGKFYGLKWGGDWQKLSDFPHLEL